jgi:hypothetical protein
MKTYGIFRVSAMGVDSIMFAFGPVFSRLSLSGFAGGGKGAEEPGGGGPRLPEGPFGAVGGGPVVFAKPGACVDVGVMGDGDGCARG